MTLARSTDPSTSSQAAASIQPKLAGLQAEVLTLIQAHPNKTARELERIALGNIPTADSVHKRVSELHEAGSIRSPGVRRCSVTGRTARVWTAIV